MNEIRYGKPSLTNLDPELGRKIFDAILSTPKPDRAKMNREADAELSRILKEMNDCDLGKL